MAKNGKAGAGSKPLNRSLSAAKSAKQDEFYTQYIDIQKEVEAYLEFNPDTFRAKIVYCNCDDPFESNFFKYFAANFNRLGLKRLVCTSYDGSPIAGQKLLFPEYDQSDAKRRKPHSVAFAVSIDEVTDVNGDGATDIDDVKLFLQHNPHSRTPLKGGGDFRSPECVELLKQADIVVTNPPFSLFREYVAQLVEHGKKFLIIGNTNAVTYKEVFRLVIDNQLWLGCTNFNVGMFFEVPNHWTHFHHIEENTGKKIARVASSCWYTNLDHGRRHSPLRLMTMVENLKFSPGLRGKSSYDRYDNYDAIEVSTYKEIPSDYAGAMGVPITFLDKYNPEQFEILGITDRDNNSGLKTKDYTEDDVANFADLNRRSVIRLDEKYVPTYARLIIRHRKPLGK